MLLPLPPPPYPRPPPLFVTPLMTPLIQGNTSTLDATPLYHVGRPSPPSLPPKTSLPAEAAVVVFSPLYREQSAARNAASPGGVLIAPSGTLNVFRVGVECKRLEPTPLCIPRCTVCPCSSMFFQATISRCRRALMTVSLGVRIPTYQRSGVTAYRLDYLTLTPQ